MPFTGSDLKTLAQAEIDDSLEDVDIIQNVNACLLEFAELFRKTATQSITVTDTNAFITRTDGHLFVVKITDSVGNNYNGEWEVSHDRAQIRIGETGTFTVTSLIIPTFITAIGNTIGVHDVFRLGMSRYIGGLFKSKDNDLNPDGLRMKAEGAGLLNRASNLLVNNDRKPGQRVPTKRSAGAWTELGSLK